MTMTNVPPLPRPKVTFVQRTSSASTPKDPTAATNVTKVVPVARGMGRTPAPSVPRVTSKMVKSA